jgi:ferredoxin
MRVFIDPELCIGCESCVDLVPEVFEMQDELAAVIEEEVPEALEEKIREAIEICPVEAIKIEE